MRLILLAIFGFIHCAPLFSQIVTISESDTGSPLEMVTLASEKPRAFATTNSRGQADIHLFKGSEKIEIRILGFKTEYRSFLELEQAGFKLKLFPSGISLNELVISSTRWNQKSKEVPAKISAISSKGVAMQNPQTSADMLATSGEVFIQKSQQGGGSPMIRGFSTNRLLYAIDGVRMNTAIFRSGNLHNVISLDPFATENTDVIFGPGSVIYGSDAIGGVMSFHTLRPQFSYTDSINFTGKIALRSSSANDERTGHIDLKAGWKKLALVSSYSHFNFGNLEMGSQGPDDYLDTFNIKRADNIDVWVRNSDPQVQVRTGYKQNNFMQKASFKPNDHWLFDYAFHYSETTGFDRFDRLNRTRNGMPLSAVWSYGPQKWRMHHLTITHEDTTRIYDELTIRLAQQKFDESRNDRDFNDTIYRIRIEEVFAWSANIDFVKYFDKHAKLYYGLEAVINDVASEGYDYNIKSGSGVFGASRYPKSDWSSYAVYANYQYRLSGKTLFQAGARYNHYLLNAKFDTTVFFLPFNTAKINNGALTGSLGMVHNPNDKWALSINASSGFRSPNVDDIGKIFDSEAGSVVVPNPDLKAERAYNIEFGITKVFSDVVKFDLTCYYTFLEDAMVRRDFRLDGLDSIIYNGELSQVQAIQNAASAFVYGVQAGLEVKLPSGLGLSSRFNYQKGEEELDDGTVSPMRHAAPFFGTVHLTYSRKRWSADLNWIFNGEVSYKNLADEFRANDYLFAKDANGNPYSPSWYTINLKGMYHINENIVLGGGVENITDQRYRTYSSGIAAAGRNFILTANLKF